MALQLVFPDTGKGNVSKTKPSKNVVENVPKHVAEVYKPRTEYQDVDSKNLTQTLKLIHVCNKPTMKMA